MGFSIQFLKTELSKLKENFILIVPVLISVFLFYSAVEKALTSQLQGLFLFA